MQCITLKKLHPAEHRGPCGEYPNNCANPDSHAVEFSGRRTFTIPALPREHRVLFARLPGDTHEKWQTRREPSRTRGPDRGPRTVNGLLVYALAMGRWGRLDEKKRAPAGPTRTRRYIRHVVKRAQGTRTSISTAWWRSARRAMPRRMPPTRAAAWSSPRSAGGGSPPRSPARLISGRSARSQSNRVEAGRAAPGPAQEHDHERKPPPATASRRPASCPR
jgi:hypothetical protein